MISLGGVTDGGTEKEGETGAKEKGEQNIMWDSGITGRRTEDGTVRQRGDAHRKARSHWSRWLVQNADRALIGARGPKHQ